MQILHFRIVLMHILITQNYKYVKGHHSNIVFKIKVTKIAQKMLFSKKFCFNMANYMVDLISGRAVGLLDGNITTDVTLTVLHLCP